MLCDDGNIVLHFPLPTINFWIYFTEDSTMLYLGTCFTGEKNAGKLARMFSRNITRLKSNIIVAKRCSSFSKKLVIWKTQWFVTWFANMFSGQKKKFLKTEHKSSIYGGVH